MRIKYSKKAVYLFLYIFLVSCGGVDKVVSLEKTNSVVVPPITTPIEQLKTASVYGGDPSQPIGTDLPVIPIINPPSLQGHGFEMNNLMNSNAEFLSLNPSGLDEDTVVTISYTTWEAKDHLEVYILHNGVLKTVLDTLVAVKTSEYPSTGGTTTPPEEAQRHISIVFPKGTTSIFLKYIAVATPNWIRMIGVEMFNLIKPPTVINPRSFRIR